MTAPGLAAARFAMSLGMGAGLGLLYGFLRPLRPKLTHLTDAVFVLCAFLGWVQLGFGLCGGELRFGYWVGMLLGAVVFDVTAGRLLRPLFFRFWGIIWQILSFLLRPIGKIFDFFKKFCKKVLAFPKKGIIMGWNICRRNGGAAHGKQKKKKSQGGSAKEQPSASRHDSGCHRIVYRGAGDAPLQH